MTDHTVHHALHQSDVTVCGLPLAPIYAAPAYTTNPSRVRCPHCLGGDRSPELARVNAVADRLVAHLAAAGRPTDPRPTARPPDRLGTVGDEGTVEVPAEFLSQLLDLAEDMEQVGWTREAPQFVDFEPYSAEAAQTIRASDQRSQWHAVYARTGDPGPPPSVRDEIGELIRAGALRQVAWYCDQAIGSSDRHQICAHGWPCGGALAVAVPPTPRTDEWEAEPGG